MKRYRLTACRPDNTTTLYTAGADSAEEVESLIVTMRAFSNTMNVTIEDKLTGIVQTRRASQACLPRAVSRSE
jgi:hypothetical protein